MRKVPKKVLEHVVIIKIIRMHLSLTMENLILYEHVALYILSFKRLRIKLGDVPSISNIEFR